ncbi:hypothetical protein PanWU01x14_328520 [Parasponia andersonii]|uniref:Uncharacterized protein n=1 Tax=Parasponia andersonii TaxID=3476 RepID=A0A2P5AIN8_PARAD|nr:hypothetical protein PanWU01x14_328520 [Parasponia andersonii]
MSRLFRIIAILVPLKLDIASLYLRGDASQWFDRRGQVRTFNADNTNASEEEVFDDEDSEENPKEDPEEDLKEDLGKNKTT